MKFQNAVKGGIYVPKRQAKGGKIEVRDKLVSILLYISQHTKKTKNKKLFHIKQWSPKGKFPPTGRHLTMSEDMFGCQNSVWNVTIICRQRSGVVLNILKLTSESPQQRIIWSGISGFEKPSPRVHQTGQYFGKMGVLIILMERNFENIFLGNAYQHVCFIYMCIHVNISTYVSFSKKLQKKIIYNGSIILLIASVIAVYHWEHLIEHQLCYTHSPSCCYAKVTDILSLNANIEKHKSISIYIILSALFRLDN